MAEGTASAEDMALHFTTLEVAPDATEEEIHAAFKTKEQEKHPNNWPDGSIELYHNAITAYEEICKSKGIAPETLPNNKDTALTNKITTLPVRRRKKKPGQDSTDKYTPKAEGGEVGSYLWGAAGLQGHRRTMEDAHIAAEVPGGYGLFGVFDGHGGTNVSLATADKATGLAAQLPSCIKQMTEGNADGSAATPRQLACAMYLAICEFDEVLRARLGDEREPSGTTATMVVVTEDSYVVANLGDSRVAVARGDDTEFFATNDHKPDNELESARVKSCGGMVAYGRVNGMLAVARAMGDFEYKNPAKPSTRHVVTACADCYVVPKSPDDEFVVLACDGVWDVMSNEEVLGFVRTALRSGKSPALCSEELTMACLKRGSQDNMSAVVVDIKGHDGGGGLAMNGGDGPMSPPNKTPDPGAEPKTPASSGADSAMDGPAIGEKVTTHTDTTGAATARLDIVCESLCNMGDESAASIERLKERVISIPQRLDSLEPK